MIFNRNERVFLVCRQIRGTDDGYVVMDVYSNEEDAKAVAGFDEFVVSRKIQPKGWRPKNEDL